MPVKASKGGEVQVQKSPAEFFAENQAIAGFDNLGKSLYTTIRELVENALDACESIEVLPDVNVSIVEYTQDEFNQQADLGDSTRPQTDTKLFQKRTSKKRAVLQSDTELIAQVASTTETLPVDSNSGVKKVPPSSSKKPKRAPQDAYFRITVSDNGCGMQHDDIPNLFGRVLSGSKYGVRQTRGKFGLGAKMALIWAKKSSGQPIRITSAHRPEGGPPPSHYSSSVLDIDIYKNAPKIIHHDLILNAPDAPIVGTTVQVLIAGNWATYKSRIVQYLQQLAVITPYAVLELRYDCNSDGNSKRHLRMRYERRSEQMPPPAATVKHHPSSLNNLVIQQLIQYAKIKNSNQNVKKMTLVKFLSTELSAVTPALAKRVIAELCAADSGIVESMHPAALSDKQIALLVQILRQVQLFRAPDGSCLSPLGEYNLALGIQKVLEPDLIATARDKPGAYEGHPFLVEAAVSLGGKQEVGVVKDEGITVVRFANRIPLLFEGGADVCTRVAQSKIRWANYKIDHKKDRVGVFVSIVSTKIPFKGTSKEYIGDDATEIQQSVKRTLQSCCQQLRAHLLKRSALKDAKERKSRLVKYIPDVSRSIFGLLEGMRKRRAEQTTLSSSDGAGIPFNSPVKRLRLDDAAACDMIRRINREEVTESLIHELLQETINEHQPRAGADQQDGVGSQGLVDVDRAPLFLVSLYNLDDSQHDISHSRFVFRPIAPVQRIVVAGSRDMNSATSIV
jgi:DNA topoisomerase VI subunit B